jgi:hypothetical protein
VTHQIGCHNANDNPKKNLSNLFGTDYNIFSSCTACTHHPLPSYAVSHAD